MQEITANQAKAITEAVFERLLEGVFNKIKEAALLGDYEVDFDVQVLLSDDSFYSKYRECFRRIIDHLIGLGFEAYGYTDGPTAYIDNLRISWK